MEFGRAHSRHPGGTFVSGAAWGEWDGALAVTTQQGREMLLLKLTADGTAVTETDSVLTDQGRLRSATRMPDGSLLVTTDNGTGDKVLRVAPTTS